MEKIKGASEASLCRTSHLPLIRLVIKLKILGFIGKVTRKEEKIREVSDFETPR
jgi:hypothetical protein